MLLLAVGTCAFGAKAKRALPKTCGTALTGGAEAQALPLHFVRLWAGETPEPGFPSIADVNGVLIWEVAEYWRTKKRLPHEEEVLAKLKKRLKADVSTDEQPNLLAGIVDRFAEYGKLPGALGSLEDILAIAVRETPGTFAPAKDAAYKEAMRYFRDRLRLPSLEEIATKLKAESSSLSIVLGDRNQFVLDAQRAYAVYANDAKKRVYRAFDRAANQRDIPDNLRTRASTPEMDELFRALVRSETNKYLQADHLLAPSLFTLEHFRLLFGGATEPTQLASDFPVPILFPGGVAELEREALLQFPAMRKNFQSDIVFDAARAERARASVEQKKGFLITSVVAGIPLVKAQWRTMLALAEEKDVDILVLPTTGVFDNLDPWLLDHPRIHVVTKPIENEFLRIGGPPTLPKNENPFMSLQKRGQLKGGQMMLVGHPQIAHKTLPRGDNHTRATEVWSVGAGSQGIYTSKHPVQARTAELAKKYHRNGFLFVEKADAQAGAMGKGAQNFWHVRPVYYIDDRELGGVAGFTDLGRRYSIAEKDDEAGDVEVDRISPRNVVLPDLHDWNANQHMMAMFLGYFRANTGIRRVFLQDVRDGASHNPHETKRTSLMIAKLRAGDLDWFREDMGIVQTVNAFQATNPDLEVVVNNANHNDWGDNAVEDQTVNAQNIVNGWYLEEQRWARRVLGVRSTLEWLLRYRNRYVKESLILADVRDRVQAESVLVDDVERVRVLPFGESYVDGPTHRQTFYNFHGHQGANGAKGSVNAHAGGSDSAIVGDSHQNTISGDLFVVGTVLPTKAGYNNGGYSSWGHAFAVSYPDGTKQLLTYRPQTGTFAQREGYGVLPPEQFFGKSPLKVVVTDNELAPNAEILDQHTKWVRMYQTGEE